MPVRIENQFGLTFGAMLAGAGFGVRRRLVRYLRAIESGEASQSSERPLLRGLTGAAKWRMVAAAALARMSANPETRRDVKVLAAIVILVFGYQIARFVLVMMGKVTA